jgi:chromosome segregation ATPase
VQKQVDKIQGRHEQFQNLYRNVDTSSSVEFKELKKGLSKELRKVERDLGGLKGAVEQIEKNRVKFPHVKDQELATRKRFVFDTQSMINDVKSSIDSSAVRRKMEEDEAKSRRQMQSVEYSTNSNSSLVNENAAFVANQSKYAHQQIRDQDVQLEGLGQAVERLDHMAGAIHDELDDQGRMLKQLDDDIDDAGNKMNFVTAQLSKLLKTKDGCQIWTIVILCMVLILLICLVIWT